MAHVKKTMKSEGGLKKTMGKKWFSHVLKTAKKSYKKGGNLPTDTDPMVAGKKRRKTMRRSRK
jgi:hypothetical protein